MIKLSISGIPKPGGSKKGFFNPKTKRVIIVDDCKKSKDWKSVVSYTARQQYQGPVLMGPLKVAVVFRMPRPKYHFRKNGTLRPGASCYHTRKPDATKLWRSTEDALTGIVWLDDSQVCVQAIYKLYDTDPGVSIKIEELPAHELPAYFGAEPINFPIVAHGRGIVDGSQLSIKTLGDAAAALRPKETFDEDEF